MHCRGVNPKHKALTPRPVTPGARGTAQHPISGVQTQLVNEEKRLDCGIVSLLISAWCYWSYTSNNILHLLMNFPRSAIYLKCYEIKDACVHVCVSAAIMANLSQSRSAAEFCEIFWNTGTLFVV